MGYIEQENCVRLCNDLARMLEEEKQSCPAFYPGISRRNIRNCWIRR